MQKIALPHEVSQGMYVKGEQYRRSMCDYHRCGRPTQEVRMSVDKVLTWTWLGWNRMW